jgi:uncharacterized membrane protein
MSGISIILTLLVWLTVVVMIFYFRAARKREHPDQVAGDKSRKPEKRIAPEPETST